jgi:hypothetical protein
MHFSMTFALESARFAKKTAPASSSSRAMSVPTFRIVAPSSPSPPPSTLSLASSDLHDLSPPVTSPHGHITFDVAAETRLRKDMRASGSSGSSSSGKVSSSSRKDKLSFRQVCHPESIVTCTTSDTKRTSDLRQDDKRRLVTYSEPQNVLGRPLHGPVILTTYRAADVRLLVLPDDVRQTQVSGLHRIVSTGWYTLSARFCAVTMSTAPGHLSLEVIRIYRDAMSQIEASASQIEASASQVEVTASQIKVSASRPEDRTRPSRSGASSKEVGASSKEVGASSKEVGASQDYAAPVDTSVSYQVLGYAECDVLADGPAHTLQVICHTRLHALECVGLQLRSRSELTIVSWIPGASHFQIAPSKTLSSACEILAPSLIPIKLTKRR